MQRSKRRAPAMLAAALPWSPPRSRIWLFQAARATEQISTEIEGPADHVHRRRRRVGRHSRCGDDGARKHHADRGRGGGADAVTRSMSANMQSASYAVSTVSTSINDISKRGASGGECGDEDEAGGEGLGEVAKAGGNGSFPPASFTHRKPAQISHLHSPQMQP